MNIPKEEHLAVVWAESIFIPGDERSRTNPGHGYPDSYETRHTYLPFKDQADLERWISSHKNEQFTVLRAQPLKVDTKVTYSFT